MMASSPSWPISSPRSSRSASRSELGENLVSDPGRSSDSAHSLLHEVAYEGLPYRRRARRSRAVRRARRTAASRRRCAPSESDRASTLRSSRQHRQGVPLFRAGRSRLASMAPTPKQRRSSNVPSADARRFGDVPPGSGRRAGRGTRRRGRTRHVTTRQRPAIAPRAASPPVIPACSPGWLGRKERFHERTSHYGAALRWYRQGRHTGRRARRT